jgi:hypothetical protein
LLSFAWIFFRTNPDCAGGGKASQGISFSSGHTRVRSLGHGLLALAREIDRTCGQKIEKKFGSLLTRLESHYEARYHDNPSASRRKSSAELREFDELILFLLDQLPMPDEVKYRSGILAKLFASQDDGALPVSLRYDEYWYTFRNEPLQKARKRLHSRFVAVREHLYPAISR